MREFRRIIFPLLIILLMLPFMAEAAGKKKKRDSRVVPASGKRVVEIAAVEGVSIEMPDEKVHNFGGDFQLKMSVRLQNGGKYVVVRDLPVMDHSAPQYEWDASYVPAASVRIHVDALNFTSGARGERMFYGFDERVRNEFNSGHGPGKNEFPLRTVSFEPNYFDRTFDAKGFAPFDSLSGLDLGDGLKIDVLFAWLALKYAMYKSQLNLRVEVDAPLAGRHEFREVLVRGRGFYFDVVGAYKGYSAGIRVARTDAMLQAFNKAMEGSLAAIEKSIGDLPLTARIDAILADGTLLLGTGLNAAVGVGTRYDVLDVPGAVVEVVSSQNNGSIAQVVQGNLKDVKPGAVLRQSGWVSSERFALASFAPAAVADSGKVEVVDLPWENIPKSDFKDGEIPSISFVTAFLKSLVETAILPYRVWRYFMYDRAYADKADSADMYEPDSVGEPQSPRPSDGWTQLVRQEPYARQIGLVDATLPSGRVGEEQSVVAIIDTGVDYNHGVLHPLLWLNPSPVTDKRGFTDRYGWDFVSGDSRPADDGYHGTQMASAVVALNPAARIMPLKVFNPWGITSSAALYGAFVYAVDHGAKIIVCGWATKKMSEALERGVAYAKAHDVLVVAAAGDRGDDLGEWAAYPAALSATFNNVITVTGVDGSDQLVKEYGKYANYGARYVTIAAPGKKILVAQPRDRLVKDTSTGIASALVAGALSRIQALSPGMSAQDWVSRMKADADVVPALQPYIHGGLRLRLRD